MLFGFIRIKKQPKSILNFDFEIFVQIFASDALSSGWDSSLEYEAS
jgi:hypothetical protein